MSHYHPMRMAACIAMSLLGLTLTSVKAQQAFPSPTPATPYAIGPSSVAAKSAATPTLAAPKVAGLRLYTLDCGRIQLPDMGMFSDTGEYDGQAGSVVAPCFVIVHPRGTLLWDTGLSDKLAGQGPVKVDGGAVLQVDRSLQSQLQTIGVQRIDYLAFSHLHFDHTGNAGAFRDAQWLVNRHELDAALSKPDAFVNADDIRPTRQTRIVNLDGDHDVFGDGSVRILRAPGHTEGHQVLMVSLANSGPVILSGDLYHMHENRQFQRVPTINANRADTLASMNRIETLINNYGARMIIQHDPRDFASLPVLPAYLD